MRILLIFFVLAAASFALLLSQLPNLHADRTTEGAPVALQRMLLDALSRQISSAYVGAAVLFSLSLCFKQMALYFAPAVFAVMLGRCFGVAQVAPMRGVVLFSALAAATSATFLAVFLPWLRIDELLEPWGMWETTLPVSLASGGRDADAAPGLRLQRPKLRILRAFDVLQERTARTGAQGRGLPGGYYRQAA